MVIMIAFLLVLTVVLVIVVVCVCCRRRKKSSGEGDNHVCKLYLGVTCSSPPGITLCICTLKVVKVYGFMCFGSVGQFTGAKSTNSLF